LDTSSSAVFQMLSLRSGHNSTPSLKTIGSQQAFDKGR
jgi:hypothetical protein